MAIDDMLKSISDRIGSVATVNTAFGEPRVMDHRALIPVALVVGGFGGGGGEGKMAAGEDGQPQEGSGGGGGGGFAVRPLAVLEVTDQQTRIIPILDLTKIILASMGLIGGMLFVLAKRKRR
jgi:uncharacterized spore protein YtfJ